MVEVCVSLQPTPVSLLDPPVFLTFHTMPPNATYQNLEKTQSLQDALREPFVGMIEEEAHGAKVYRVLALWLSLLHA